MFVFTSVAISIALVHTNNVRKPDNPELPLGFDLDNLGIQVRADSQYRVLRITSWKSIQMHKSYSNTLKVLNESLEHLFCRSRFNEKFDTMSLYLLMKLFMKTIINLRL